jgi:hypothetical protein
MYNYYIVGQKRDETDCMAQYISVSTADAKNHNQEKNNSRRKDIWPPIGSMKQITFSGDVIIMRYIPQKKFLLKNKDNP